MTCSLALSQQLPIARVELMPNHPKPYLMRDWAKVARDYDAFVFDFDRRGEHLPLIWWDRTRNNFPMTGFGMPSYVGTPHQTRDNHHESINCMAAVVGATLVGIDKSSQQGHNFVLMCQKYFCRDNGTLLYLNGTTHGTGGSFWYETYPSLLFAQLLCLYPDTGQMEQHLKISADRMGEAIVKLCGDADVPDFDHTAFNFHNMQPVDNGRWKEPDAAAGYAWFEYMAHVKTGKPKYLRCADQCMQFLQRRPEKDNPYYEVLLPYAAYLAARMNAELGRQYDVGKLLGWCFGASVARPNWGVLADRWGEVEVSGLSGSIVDGGGYAFAMNTFDQAATLAPLVRYDDRYARAIGKYVLNLANSARLFYANAHADDHQNSAAWAHKHDPDYCIAYEGCRRLGRRAAKADADYRTIAGEIVSGDYGATRFRHERPRAYEVLREKISGDHDRLEHVWTLPLEPAVHRYFHVDARCEDAGDADAGFRFSYADKPEGPYTPMFTVRADADKLNWWPIPAELGGTLYVKVEDTDRTGGQKKPDVLYVDSIFMMFEFAKTPFGMGDAVGGRPHQVATDFGLYGSSHVGFLGGIVKTTDVEEILQIDLLKTDWYHGRAYPSYLYFNPYAQQKTVTLDVGPQPRDLYDAAGNRFLAKATTGKTPIGIPPDSAVIVVVCPAGGSMTRDANKTLIDGVTVDFNNGH